MTQSNVIKIDKAVVSDSGEMGCKIFKERRTEFTKAPANIIKVMLRPAEYKMNFVLSMLWILKILRMIAPGTNVR